MSVLAFKSVVEALVAALTSDPALAGWTITDRPARPDGLPHLRIGPASQDPWTTNASHGAALAITLDLTTRTGSFTGVEAASDAIARLLEGPPLILAGGTSVLQRVSRARFAHDAALDLERATLTARFLIDLGDRA